MKIYHFTNQSAAIEKIIPNMALKFNSIKNTNDPREYYAWSLYEEKSEEDFEKSMEIGQKLRENCKILCFNKGNDGFKNLMMWAHYGDNHRGICLEIDEDKFLESNGELFNNQSYFMYDKINYRSEENTPSFSIPRINLNKTNNVIDENYKELFFTKYECWQEEQEWRILIKANENINLICDLKNSLDKVILGLNFPWVYLPSVEYLCELSEIPLYRSFYLQNKIRIYKHKKGVFKPEIHQNYQD